MEVRSWPAGEAREGPLLEGAIGSNGSGAEGGRHSQIGQERSFVCGCFFALGTCAYKAVGFAVGSCWCASSAPGPSRARTLFASMRNRLGSG
jgi:hypothetical protein